MLQRVATCMHRLLGVSETYLRVRSHAPLSCYDGASAYRYVAGPKPPEAEHRLHVTLQYVLDLRPTLRTLSFGNEFRQKTPLRSGDDLAVRAEEESKDGFTRVES